MDIEKFDRLYPSPAHAAAADLRDRYAPKHFQPEAGTLVTDRAGIVIGVAALAAAFFGGTAYVLTAGYTIKAIANKRTIQVVAAVPAAKRVAVTPDVPVPAEPTVAPRRTLVVDSRTRRAPELKKPVPERRESSGWILDPLSGDALAAALVIDKQRTIELNAQQLGKMTKDDIRSQPKTDAGGDQDPGRS